MTSPWITVTEEEQVTCNIVGSVQRCDELPGVYVTLVFSNRCSTTMHDTLARQLRDWLVAHVPDDGA
jgi:hypothetical protein